MDALEAFKKLFNTEQNFKKIKTLGDDWKNLWFKLGEGDTSPWLGGTIQKVADDVMGWTHEAINGVQFLGYDCDWYAMAAYPYRFLYDIFKEEYGDHWFEGYSKTYGKTLHDRTGIDMAKEGYCSIANVVGLK